MGPRGDPGVEGLMVSSGPKIHLVLSWFVALMLKNPNGSVAMRKSCCLTLPSAGQTLPLHHNLTFASVSSSADLPSIFLFNELLIFSTVVC